MRPVVLEDGIAITEANSVKGAVRAARAYLNSYGVTDRTVVGAVRERCFYVPLRDRTYDADDMHGRDVYVVYLHAHCEAR
jgi:hypothetical protein